jgi:hypothetical protein
MRAKGKKNLKLDFVLYLNIRWKIIIFLFTERKRSADFLHSYVFKFW